ncbi:hypothetical protein F9L33_01290 [Amylibacter sp. SFDW26]|uniref:hypothetical protein n=1 Tax=Amylibacter sp. SFDW26 TaxID=2652722 RepID=UPI00126164B6|nr:hypothetical protein [Amylibacter sp. SFDW26]KAB7615429.1 hypothetical protein F9L33_01290 [Amylibacter sp. SFDW26]
MKYYTNRTEQERSDTYMTQTPSAFALDLSNDGIFLWHRKPEQKWEFLGSVPLTSGNLRQQLETLKQAAEAIEPGPRSAIVRIPTAEVKTLIIKGNPDSSISLEEHIVRTLEHAANMPIKNILFDIEHAKDGIDFNVAWTSVDVVKQAETFVHMIGFTPSQYTTDVNANAFPRRPNFQLHPASPAPVTPQDSLESEVISAMEEFDDDYDDDSIVENLFNEGDEEVEPSVQTDQSPPAKTEFGLLWFVALFLILGSILAGIYLWPKIHKTAQHGNGASYDQLILASSITPQIFSFEKSKLIL